VADPPASPAVPATPIPTQRNDLTQELIARAAWRQGVIASINVAATILAVRLILLLAVLGAFGLAWVATQNAQPMQLGAVALYLAGVILPLVWLSGRR